MSPVENPYLLFQPQLGFSEAFKRCFLLTSIALGGFGIFLTSEFPAWGCCCPSPVCCWSWVPSHLPSHIPPTCWQGLQQGLASPRNSQVGRGGSRWWNRNIPVLMKEQFNAAIRAGGGGCKLSHIFHGSSQSNPSPDLANRHSHL